MRSTREKAIITGNFNIKEAKDLALVLNFGALPVTLTVIQVREWPESKLADLERVLPRQDEA